jgi:glyoxylase-like metal-dependent hydrolase (beta-lactamase superfamily II)
LPLPGDGLRAVNVYLLDATDGIVMVDGGWALPESRLRLERAMASIGHDLTDISRILVTHVHRDHYTQAVELRRLFGARVALGAGERHGLEMLNRIRSNVPVSSLDSLRRNGADDLASRVGRTLDEFDATNWEAPDEWLDAGELEVGDRTLRVIPTPGHTKGHVVFLDERAKLLFAGDHVLPHITPSIGFELGEPGSPLVDYLNSLRLMTTYADARLLPAHGPVAASTHARVADLLAHHDIRLAEAVDALGSDELDAHAVARRLTWTRRRIGFTDLDDFNRMLAINETAAHLQVLVRTGQAAVVTNGGIDRFQRAV